VVLTVISAEILLRVTGLGGSWAIPAVENEPTMSKPDAILGWRVIPGKFKAPPYSQEGTEAIYTFLKDGSRATSEDEETGPYDLIFLGCSFTQGFAVSDRDTFPWKIQSEFPSMKIGNFGTCGYGTYQSLLLLRELYKQNIKPAIVVYGFLPFHEERNIAHSEWLRSLSRSSRRGHIATPFCSLNYEGELMEHKPVAYPVLPFREHIFSIAFLSKVYYRYVDQEERRRRQAGSEVTEKLILAMNSLAKKNGSDFSVAILADPKQYESFFKTSGLGTIDCRLELDKDHIVSGESHPNGKAHSIWAGEMATFLKASKKDISRQDGGNFQY
jgi:hypothetical protein